MDNDSQLAQKVARTVDSFIEQSETNAENLSYSIITAKDIERVLE